MDRRKDSPQVQRLEVVELGRRRRWTTEAKERIVEESLAGHRQGSATARRHGISTSLLFAWRRAYRTGALVDGMRAGFVPVVVEERRVASPRWTGRIEIIAPSGRRVVVDAGVDEMALMRVLSVLARA